MVSFTYLAPWYTSELHLIKSRKCQLERLYKKTGLTVHFQAYTDHLKQYKNSVDIALSSYYSHLIHSSSNNPKTLFSTINKLLKLSDNTSTYFTVDKYKSFFQKKINTICSNVTTSPTPSTPPPASPLLPHSLSHGSPRCPLWRSLNSQQR